MTWKKPYKIPCLEIHSDFCCFFCDCLWRQEEEANLYFKVSSNLYSDNIWLFYPWCAYNSTDIRFWDKIQLPVDFKTENPDLAKIRDFPEEKPDFYPAMGVFELRLYSFGIWMV